jgi:hypothetical protein
MVSKSRAPFCCGDSSNQFFQTRHRLQFCDVLVFVGAELSSFSANSKLDDQFLMAIRDRVLNMAAILHIW